MPLRVDVRHAAVNVRTVNIKRCASEGLNGRLLSRPFLFGLHSQNNGVPSQEGLRADLYI
jgi:hypothetical protein